MNKIKTFLTTGATVAMLAIPVAAQTPTAPASSSAPQDAACKQEAKDANYKIFRETLKTDQPKAYEAAKKYLACPAAATPTEGETKIIEYLNRWTKLYEEGSKKNRLTQLLYVDKKYDEAFVVGREILAAEPEYVKGLVDLGANGYLVAPLKNDQLTNEAVQYAKKSLQLLESGKTLEDWGPLQNKDVATAYLNYTIGALTVEKDPANALKYLIKSAQFETPLKKSAVTYALIAGAYETGPYAKQSAEYKEKYFGKDETPESKLALANVNQLVDRMIDGYARAVALVGTDSKLAAQKTAWNENLTNLYKYRHESETGLTEMVASILSKPLPPEPTPLTVLPPTPAATPAGTSGGAAPTSGSGAGNGAAAAPVNKTTTPTTTPATANTKPASDKPGTNPNKPRNRR